MKQYIEKSEVIAEIESKIKEWRLGSSSEAKFRIEAYKELSEWLDTLEVKEEPVSEDLDEAAKKAATWHSRVRGDVFLNPSARCISTASDNMEKDNKQRFNPGDHVALTNINCEIEHLIVTKVTVLDDRVMYWTLTLQFLLAEMTSYADDFINTES